VVGVYILNVNLTNSILYYRGREKKNQGSGWKFDWYSIL
jgi:hypothetical protein